MFTEFRLYRSRSKPFINIKNEFLNSVNKWTKILFESVNWLFYFHLNWRFSLYSVSLMSDFVGRIVKILNKCRIACV